jgi:cell division septal protein FtsQ
MGAALSFGALVWVSGQPFATISEVHVAGTAAADADRVAEIAEQSIAGAYLGLFSKSNIALYPKKTIERSILLDVPRIAHADVTLENLDRLVVTVKEREVNALWCGDIVPDIVTDTGGSVAWEATGSCYLMDEKGFIFEEAPQYDGPVYPRYYGALERGEPLAQYFLSLEEFSALQDFHVKAHEAGLPIVGLLIVDERDMELYLESGMRVLLPRHGNNALLLENLLTVLNAEAFPGQNAVEYVDLRFGNKAYFKEL